jgi:hypothetical protein
LEPIPKDSTGTTLLLYTMTRNIVLPVVMDFKQELKLFGKDAKLLIVKIKGKQ